MPISHKATGSNLALVAVGAALIAASTLWGGYPMGTGVPITLQTLAILLAGSVLGAYRGAAAVLVYLALGSAGMPVWSGHGAGLQVWTTPRAGFLISFVLAAFVTGWIAERVTVSGNTGLPSFLVATTVGALAVITILGWAYFGWRGSLSLDATMAALAPFLPGDILKAVLAAGVAAAVHAAYPEILAPHRGGRTRRGHDSSPATTGSPLAKAGSPGPTKAR
jgi:biotin transport system substrate-specific component